MADVMSPGAKRRADDKRCAALAPFDLVPLAFSVRYPRCDIDKAKVHQTHRHTRKAKSGSVTWRWKGVA
jgi:hypothetical protein